MQQMITHFLYVPVLVSKEITRLASATTTTTTPDFINAPLASSVSIEPNTKNIAITAAAITYNVAASVSEILNEIEACFLLIVL